jgi:hypothetical protein
MALMAARNRYRLLAAAIAAFAVTVAGFYAFTRAMSSHEAVARGMSPGSRNAIQHGYGAAELYGAGRWLAVPKRPLRLFVELLGHVNEWTEHTFKSRKDESEEVYKDLHNNLVGLVAVQWLEKRHGRWFSPAQRRTLIGWLAEREHLIYASSDSRIPRFDSGIALAPALARYRGDRSSIMAGTQRFLDLHAATVVSEVLKKRT